jgi:hypothetical protein
MIICGYMASKSPKQSTLSGGSFSIDAEQSPE